MIILKKTRESPKIELAKGRVVSVKQDYIVIAPLHSSTRLFIDGNFTCSLAMLKRSREPEIEDEVIAYNIHKVDKGWRAKKATLLEE